MRNFPTVRKFTTKKTDIELVEGLLYEKIKHEYKIDRLFNGCNKEIAI